MAVTKAAKRLKKSWMEMPGECFEPMTFGELKVGQKFICLPEPDGNDGHSGLRGKYNLFTKTRERVIEAAPGLPYGIPHGSAIRNSTETVSNLPNLMLVILVA